MTAPSNAAVLARRALALLDVLSDRAVRDILERRERSGARITVRPSVLSDLIDAVEVAYPGVKAAYLDARELERRERTHPPTPKSGETHA